MRNRHCQSFVVRRTIHGAEQQNLLSRQRVAIVEGIRGRFLKDETVPLGLVSAIGVLVPFALLPSCAPR
jgi:hypothetical protein